MSFKTTLYGKYFLLDRIAVGGMAEVFKAKMYGVRGFERLLVIKRILPHLSKDEEFIEMFIDEAKISVELSHANICQVSDLGKIGDNYFIAMEYIDGKDLRAILKKCHAIRTPLPVSLSLYIAMEALKGLDYAHRKSDINGKPLNIIHRDISPQNLMCSYHGEVKIVDFGIAKTESKLNRTQAGVLKGKFGYMSPEQASGLELDARTDLFSMGIILYEMLTGRRLFLGENDFETLEKIKDCVVPPPSKFNQSISPELEQIVLKALAKDADDRFGSASEMQVALSKYFYTSYTDTTSRTLSDYLRKLFAEEIEIEQEALRRAIDSLPPEELEAVISSAESQNDRLVESGSLARRSPSGSRRTQVPIGTQQVQQLQKGRSFFGSLLRGMLLMLIPAALVIGGWKYILPLVQKPPKIVEPRVIPQTNRTIEIVSDPPSADVTIDGEPKGVTPLSVTLLLNQYHVIRLEKEGFQSREEKIFVDKEKESYGPFVMAKAAPATGNLVISSTPPGADITIDGQGIEQKTPATLEDLPLDKKVKVKISLQGYIPQTQTFVFSGPSGKLNFNLQSALSTVTLRVTPENATVYWDGKEGGFERLNLEPGKSYTLKVVAPGFEPLVRKITPKASHEYVDIILKAVRVVYGTVSLGANPWAKVFVDGKDSGVTPVVDLKLSVGMHTIEFTNEHFASVTKKIKIVEGKNPALVVDLHGD